MDSRVEREVDCCDEGRAAKRGFVVVVVVVLLLVADVVWAEEGWD